MTKKLKLTIIISIILLVVLTLSAVTLYTVKFFTTESALKNMEIASTGNFIEDFDWLLMDSEVFRRFLQIQAVIL